MMRVFEDDGLVIDQEGEATTVVLDGMVVTDETWVRIHDIMKAGHCVSGAQAWFESLDLDYRDFVRNGISGKTLLETRDGNAIMVVRRKLVRENGRSPD